MKLAQHQSDLNKVSLQACLHLVNDGRTVRARNADVVRSYLRAGRLPLDSVARRSGEDEWLPLDHIAEFVDALPAEATRPTDGRTSRIATTDLRAVGVRGLVEELFNAFDSCLNRAKLIVAALTGVALAIGVIAIVLIALILGAVLFWLPIVVLIVAAAIVGSRLRSRFRWWR